jgi:CBS domain-containing protein
MHTLQVHQIETLSRSRLATVSMHTPLLLAAQSLSQTQIGLLVVCDPDGAMVGVISKTDIIRNVSRCLGGACQRLSSEIMTKKVVACRPADLLHDVLSNMQAHGLVHVPVLDADQRPVGVVNARDALRALVAQGSYEQSQLFDYVMGVGYH